MPSFCAIKPERIDVLPSFLALGRVVRYERTLCVAGAKTFVFRA
jgi:hypothetical protein